MTHIQMTFQNLNNNIMSCNTTAVYQKPFHKFCARVRVHAFKEETHSENHQ